LSFDGGGAGGALGGGQAIDAGGMESGVHSGVGIPERKSVEGVVSLPGVSSGE
jgi:hypothetical protein